MFPEVLMVIEASGWRHVETIRNDVSFVGNVALGDEVVLVGKQKDREINVSSFSDMNNSINYELLTRLPHHIPRNVVE